MSEKIQKMKELLSGGFTINYADWKKKQYEIKKDFVGAGSAGGSTGAQRGVETFPFVTDVVDRAGFMDDFGLISMDSKTARLDRLTSDEETIRRGNPGEEISISGSVTVQNNTLTLVDLITKDFVSYEFVQHGAESLSANQAAVEDIVLQRYDNGVAKLMVTGSGATNVGVSANFISSMDGIISQSEFNTNTNIVSEPTASPAPAQSQSSQEMFNLLQRMYDNMPDAYQSDLEAGNAKFYCSFKRARDYKRFLNSLENPLGHTNFTQAGIPLFENVEVKGTHFFPSDKVLLSINGNLVRGSSRLKRVDFVNEPSKLGWDVIISSEEGVEKRDNQALVLGLISGSAAGSTIQ